MNRTLHYTSYLILLLFCTLSSQILEAQYTPKDSTRGKQLLSRFCSKMGGVNSLRATFSFEVLFPTSKTPAEYKATLESRGNQFFLSVMGIEIYSDTQTRWQYTPAKKDVVITQVDSTSASPLDNPLQLLKYDISTLRIEFRGERTEKNSTYYDLSLYPLDINQPYTQIHLTLHKRTLYPAKLSYFGRDGVRYKVSVDQFEANAKVRARFALDVQKLKGVRITDLRE
ncbi:MAG: LolA family protein [Bacteroides sp.]